MTSASHFRLRMSKTSVFRASTKESRATSVVWIQDTAMRQMFGMLVLRWMISHCRMWLISRLSPASMIGEAARAAPWSNLDSSIQQFVVNAIVSCVRLHFSSIRRQRAEPSAVAMWVYCFAILFNYFNMNSNIDHGRVVAFRMLFLAVGDFCQSVFDDERMASYLFIEKSPC